MEMEKEVKVTIDIIGRERNVSETLKMLRYMQYLAGIGHSTDFKVWVDGDGAGGIKIDIPSWTEESKEDLLQQIRDRVDKWHNIKSFDLD